LTPTVPLTVPGAVGANATLIVQEPWAATEAQLSVLVKLALGVTLKAMDPLLLLVTVNILATLVDPIATFPNARLAGVIVTGATPVPASAAVCVTGVALSVTVSVPVLAPIAVGVKVSVIMQLPLAGTELPQLFVWAKSPAVAMLLTKSATVVLPFLRVTVEAALVLPSPTLPKLRTVESVAVCPKEYTDATKIRMA